MNHCVTMCVGDRGAHVTKKFQSFSDRESMFVAILIDWQPFDVLHYEIRQAVLGCAAVEEARDIRMIEAGEYLSLVTEVAKHRIGIHATLDQLNSDPFFVLFVGTLSQIHAAHPTGADPSQDFVVTDRLADQRISFVTNSHAATNKIGYRHFDEVSCVSMCG